MQKKITQKPYLLAIILILSLSFPLAKGETTTASAYNGGTGTEDDPYQINTLAQLRRLSETTDDWEAYFIQTADIDATDTQTWNVGDHDDDTSTDDEAMGFSPIGDRTYYSARQGVNFNGSYNGNGYAISNLYINRPTENNVGLFGCVYGSSTDLIQYLALTNADITGNRYVGVIAGESTSVYINNCYATGTVYADYDNVGGLVGKCGYANNCYAEVEVNCSYDSKGGLGCGYWNTTYQVDCYYNSDIFTDSNDNEYGTGLSTTELGNIGYYSNWNIITDESLVQGDAPVLSNNGDNPTWLINPATTYTVTFVIKDSDNNLIEDAIIECNGEITTDENGEAQASALPNTTASYSITAYGMQKIEGTIDIESSDISQEISLSDAYDGGDGTENDPFQIATLEQLANLSENTLDWEAYYIQTADIDATETNTWNVDDHDEDTSTADEAMGFSPIGDSSDGSRQNINFDGSYNGNGYAISNLYINRPTESRVGLFGYAGGSSSHAIQYLALINADITGKSKVGTIAGVNYSTRVNYCYATGKVNGGSYTGGLVGYCGYANYCYAEVEVTSTSSYKGGLGASYGTTSRKVDCYYNSDIFTDSNDNEYGTGISTSQMGVLGYYSNWSIITDESLTQGAAPTLSNNGDNPTWVINPAITYTVTFILKDSDENLIVGATIDCNGEITTDENGEAEASLLPNSSSEYTIEALGMLFEEGTVSIESTNITKEISLVEAYNGGDGTEGDPFQIATLEQLGNLSENTHDWDAYFIQTANIDATETNTWNVGDHDDDDETEDEAMGFSPIGDREQYSARQGVYFNGSYNGDGYTISNLYINRPTESYVGLFGRPTGTSSSYIKQIALIDADITGNNNVGTIAGESISVRIKNCYATGKVQGGSYTGGLVGKCGYATNCYAATEVISSHTYNGGLGCGYWNTTNQENCYYNSDIYTDANEYGYGTGLTSEEMGVESNYNTWDFVNESTNGDEDIWAICTGYNSGYPYLARGITEISLEITSGSTFYSGAAQSFDETLISGLPEGITPIIYYRLASEETEESWSTTAPSDVETYDIKVLVEPSESYLAAIATLEDAWMINKVDATITFESLEDKTYGDETFELSASVTGDASITYTSSNTSVATISGTTVTIIGAGSTTITASAAETDNANAATDVAQSLTVNKTDATITFESLEDKTYGDETFELSASVTGDASITYTSSNTSVATISGTTVTVIGAGSTTITASAAETDNANAATDVAQSLTVNKATSNITWSIEGTTIYKSTTDVDFTLTTATTTTGNTISYSSENTSVATVDETSGEVSIVGIGTTTITATVAASANYEQATATVTLAVSTTTALEQTEVMEFTMYPNPAATEITISGVNDETIEIYSLSGNKVISVSNTNTINISQLPKGIYLVKVGSMVKQLLVN